MTTAGSLPDRPDAVTPEWLTGALGASVPGVEVADVEVLDQHSGTTGRLRLRLRYAPGPQGPETVFVKLPPFDEAQQRLVAATDMGRREARFYAGPAAEAPLRIPRAYHAAYGDEPTEYVMVLEDLVASGCRFTTRREPHDGEQSGQLIEALARLHAHFWDDPRFDDELVLGAARDAGPFGAKLVDQRPRAVRRRHAAGVHRAVPALRRAPRAHLRAVGRRRADADPRRHALREPVPVRRRSGSACTTGR